MSSTSDPVVGTPDLPTVSLSALPTELKSRIVRQCFDQDEQLVLLLDSLKQQGVGEPMLDAIREDPGTVKSLFEVSKEWSARAAPLVFRSAIARLRAPHFREVVLDSLPAEGFDLFLDVLPRIKQLDNVTIDDAFCDHRLTMTIASPMDLDYCADTVSRAPASINTLPTQLKRWIVAMCAVQDRLARELVLSVAVQYPAHGWTPPKPSIGALLQVSKLWNELAALHRFKARTSLFDAITTTFPTYARPGNHQLIEKLVLYVGDEAQLRILGALSRHLIAVNHIVLCGTFFQGWRSLVHRELNGMDNYLTAFVKSSPSLQRLCLEIWHLDGAERLKQLERIIQNSPHLESLFGHINLELCAFPHLQQLRLEADAAIIRGALRSIRPTTFPAIQMLRLFTEGKAERHTLRPQVPRTLNSKHVIQVVEESLDTLKELVFAQLQQPIDLGAQIKLRHWAREHGIKIRFDEIEPSPNAVLLADSCTLSPPSSDLSDQRVASHVAVFRDPIELAMAYLNGELAEARLYNNRARWERLGSLVAAAEIDRTPRLL
ncbi:hypothetical protein JCM10449v2_003374 [Rhodotorula kratochvilovae]